MPASSLALVIVAGPIHAIWNITVKKAGRDVRFATFTGLLVALIWAPLGITLGWEVLPIWSGREMGAGRRERNAARAVLHRAAARLPQSRPDRCVSVGARLGTLLTSLVAIWLFGERIIAFGIAGIFAVVAGVFFITGGPGMFVPRTIRQSGPAFARGCCTAC